MRMINRDLQQRLLLNEKLSDNIVGNQSSEIEQLKELIKIKEFNNTLCNKNINEIEKTKTMCDHDIHFLEEENAELYEDLKKQKSIQRAQRRKINRLTARILKYVKINKNLRTKVKKGCNDAFENLKNSSKLYCE